MYFSAGSDDHRSHSFGCLYIMKGTRRGNLEGEAPTCFSEGMNHLVGASIVRSDAGISSGLSIKVSVLVGYSLALDARCASI